MATDKALRALPDLIEALEACLDFLDSYVDVIDGDDGKPRPNRAMSLFIQVETALAKAGVEQP